MIHIVIAGYYWSFLTGKIYFDPSNIGTALFRHFECQRDHNISYYPLLNEIISDYYTLLLSQSIILKCLRIGTLKSIKFSICSKWKINGF